MNDVPGTLTTRWRALWFAALIGLPVLGWLGVLDAASEEHVGGSLSTAGLIYGTARGINALVSLLQGTELSVPFVTLSVGEVLDPVNDLIERFSDIILVALGSLALQKILLALVSDTLFNALLSLVAVAAALVLLRGEPKLVSALLRSFVIVAFVRFSLGLVVLANNWVDRTFLYEADRARHEAMETFQGELRQVDALARQGAEPAAVRQGLQRDLAELELRVRELAAANDGLETRIRRGEADLEALAAQAGYPCRLIVTSRTCPPDVTAARDALDALRAQRDDTEEEMQAAAASARDLREEIDCLERRQRGEDCGFLDAMPSLPDAAALRQKLLQINADLGDFAETCINLLVSLLLKTVAIPLLFLYLLYRLAGLCWKRL